MAISTPPTRTANTVEHPLPGRVAKSDASVSEQPTMTAGPNDDAPAERLASGTVVDRYVIDHALGEGGMGVVYKAFDPKLERAVALKLVSVQASRVEMRDRLRARLLREAQALAQLTHPNVVSVYDTGVAGERVFIAMELVEGVPLSEYCAPSHGRTTDELLSAYLAAGEGLAAAHRAGLVHRDFKPHNVIMGDDGRIRVIDFGLARVDELTESRASSNSGSGVASSESDAYFDVGASSSDGWHSANRSSGAALTELGAVMGTPRYMAPEQHEGKIADHRADQYSFCASLYHALSGVAPFAGNARKKIYDNMKRRAFATPTAGRAIPRRVRNILARGLSLEPAERFEDMDALLSALRRSRGRARVFALAAAALLMPLLAVGWAQWQAQPYERCLASADNLAGLWKSETAAPIEAAFTKVAGRYGAETYTRAAARLSALSTNYEDTYRDSCQRALQAHTQSTRWLDERMACLGRVRNRTALMIEQWKAPDRAQVDSALNALESLESIGLCSSNQMATALQRPGTMADPEYAAFEKALDEGVTLHDVGRFKEANRIFAELWLKAKRHRPSTLTAWAAYHLGLSEAQLSQVEEAQRTLLIAIEDAVASRNEAVELKAMVELAQLQLLRGQATTGHLLALTSRWRLQSTQDDPGAELRALRLLGYAAEGTEDFDSASENYDDALALAKRALGPLEVARVNAYYGKLRSLQGRHAEGAALLRASIQAFEEAYGRQHPSTIVWLTFLGETEQHLGEFEAASAHISEVLAADRERFGDTHEDVAIDYRVLADIALARGELSTARELYRKSRTVFSEIYGDDHPLVTEISAKIAQTSGFSGDAAEAAAQCGQVFLRRGETEESDEAHLYSRLLCARTMLDAGDAKKNLAFVRGLHDYATSKRQRAHAVRVRADVLLALALVNAGLVREAEPLADKILADLEALPPDPFEKADGYFAVARTFHAARRPEAAGSLSQALELLAEPKDFPGKRLRAQMLALQAKL